MLRRMIGAAVLNVQVYEEVEHDESLNRESFAVVVLVSLLGGLGYALRYTLQEGAAEYSRTFLSLAFGTLGWVLMWYFWSGITYYVGSNWLGGTADVGQMRRAIGYANTPRAIALFLFVPKLGVGLDVVAHLWVLVASVVAIRQALDFGTGRAIATVLIGWVVAFMVFVLVGMLVGVFTLAAAIPFVS